MGFIGIKYRRKGSKTRMMGYQMVKTLFYDWFRHLDAISACEKQTSRHLTIAKTAFTQRRAGKKTTYIDRLRRNKFEDEKESYTQAPTPLRQQGTLFRYSDRGIGANITFCRGTFQRPTKIKQDMYKERHARFHKM